MNRSHLRLVPDDMSDYDREVERRITTISEALKKAMSMGSFGVSRAIELQRELAEAVAARSLAQVERMERAKGLRR